MSRRATSTPKGRGRSPNFFGRSIGNITRRWSWSPTTPRSPPRATGPCVCATESSSPESSAHGPPLDRGYAPPPPRGPPHRRPPRRHDDHLGKSGGRRLGPAVEPPLHVPRDRVHGRGDLHHDGHGHAPVLHVRHLHAGQRAHFRRLEDH